MDALETLAEQMGREDALDGLSKSDCLLYESIFIAAWIRGWESVKQPTENFPNGIDRRK